MSDISVTAISGLQAASARFEASARRVATDRNADFAEELAKQKQAALEFRANMAALRAAHEMAKKTLDILV